MTILTNFQTRPITDEDRRGPLAEVINRNGATSLTTVNEELLAKLAIPNKYPTVVISILGNSRSGKSAFLNCIISYAKSTNIAAFVSMSSKASKGLDVTHGMNYYVISDDKAKINYLFIDVQGLGGEISIADPTVLLFTYYISDVIIVNHRGRFESATIQVLTPITTLIAKLKNKPVKPLLLFRIFDVDEEYDNVLADQNYKVVMKPRDDQYAGVRQCIAELFIISNPPILFTRTPSKETRDRFDSGNFCDAINDTKDKLYFEHAAISIMNLINGIKGEPEKVKYIQSVAKNINSHSADINVSVFDTSSQVTMNDVSVWIYGSTFLKQGQTAVASMVPAELTKEINILYGTHSEYQELIAPREKLVTDTIQAFNTRFSAIPKDIKDQGLEKLGSIIKPALVAAISKSNQLAETICSGILAAKYVDLSNSIFSDLSNNAASFARFKDEILLAINTGGANACITAKYHRRITSDIDILSKLMTDIELARSRLENKSLDDTVEAFKNYKYQLNLTPYLSKITLGYDECVSQLGKAFIKSQNIQNSTGLMGKIVEWLTGTSKKLYPTLYKVDTAKLIFIRYEDDEVRTKHAKTLEEYNSRYWKSMETAKNEFISKFADHTKWFEKTRLANLQEYINEQCPANLDERSIYYEAVAKHNNVVMIDFHNSAIQKHPAYVYLTQMCKINVRWIYTPENFKKVIPGVVQKHFAAIEEYQQSDKRLGLIDFMVEQMFIAWYNFVVQDSE